MLLFILINIWTSRKSACCLLARGAGSGWVSLPHFRGCMQMKWPFFAPSSHSSWITLSEEQLYRVRRRVKSKPIFFQCSKMFLLVEFTDKKVAVVCGAWVEGNQTFWPLTHTDSQRTKAVSQCVSPDPTWPQYTVKVLGSYRKYNYLSFHSFFI